jgi:hypothetical protein
MLRAAVVFPLLLAAPVLPAVERPARYLVVLADGQRIESDRLAGWHTPAGSPSLADRPLLEPSNPFRWLRNRTTSLGEPPESYVEFTTGDRLPGIVVAVRQEDAGSHDSLPSHLVIRTPLKFEPPYNRPMPEVRVALRFVRRIVWQRQAQNTYLPGTAIYSDGRWLTFRAARLHAGEVRLLTDDGEHSRERRVPCDDLAELHLPVPESWTSWLEQLAVLCPDRGSRLIHIDTSTGLIATGSLARFDARFEGNSADPDRWVHGIQPAWSLDVLWIPFREIAIYRSFGREEVPLSQIRPRRVVQRPALAEQRGVQVDRSALGSLLSSGSREFGFGLGVLGATDVEFDLPAAARSVRTVFCLDRAAGDGGCVRPEIMIGDPTGAPSWQGPVLVGSSREVDSGEVPIPATREPRVLTLRVDALLTKQPPGADPLDIRDYANWCEPVVRLDIQPPPR